MSANNNNGNEEVVVQAQAQGCDLKRPRCGDRIPFQQVHDDINNVVTTNQRYAGMKKNTNDDDHHHHRRRDEYEYEYEYEYSDHHSIDEKQKQKLMTKRPNRQKIMGISQQHQHQHHRSEVNYLSQPPPPPPSYHGLRGYEGGPYDMLHPPLSYKAEYYPPYHQSYLPSHIDIDIDIDNKTGAGAETNNAVNNTSTAAAARGPSPPPQTNNHYCPSLAGNDSSSINSNDCNYEYDDVIEESDNNNSNNNNTNGINNRQRLLEERKSDSNDNNDDKNVFLSNAMSSNFSSASSGNDSAAATIDESSIINDANKRRKLDSSNKNVTAITYTVPSIIAKKDGIVQNVRPVAVTYTHKRGGGGGGGGGGVLPLSTSTTTNRRHKKKEYHTIEERLVQLTAYKEKNGDCNDPYKFKGYGNLDRWVSNQRQEYKLYKENKSNSMTKERSCALEKLDFEWRSDDNHTFEERLVQLADYKENNGDCNVSYRFKGYGNLGMWIHCQRQEYKKYKGKKASKLTKGRICALEKLDFKWQAKHGPAPGIISYPDSLLAPQENGDNRVVAVAPSVPAPEVPLAETVVDVEKEDQIEREDDDQLIGDDMTSSYNNINHDNNGKNIGEDNIYRAEGDDHYDCGGWRDLGDDFHDSDDDCLVF
jgi:hypothetical protein